MHRAAAHESRVPSGPGTEPLGARLRRQIRRYAPAADLFLRRRALADGLRRLADALANSPLSGRYWLVGGLLLGWARDGRPLDSDLEDADFAYLDEDHEQFLAAVPALARAGFVPRHRYTGHDGRALEHQFRRGGVQYDFFRLTPVGDRFRYSTFVLDPSPMELIAEVPAQPRAPFRFVGRTWLKVADHDLALRSIYGDWRTERAGWRYTADRAIVERVALSSPRADWNGKSG